MSRPELSVSLSIGGIHDQRIMQQLCNCRHFALRYKGSTPAHVELPMGNLGGMTQLTFLSCECCKSLEQYAPIVGLPSLMHLNICVMDGHPPDAEALRAQYATLSSKLTSLGFSGGTQIMVRQFLL